MNNLNLKALIKVANELDKKGFFAEASEIDNIVKIAVSHSGITRALKLSDPEEAKRALTDFIRSLPWGTTPDKELRMTPEEFNEFAEAIKSKNMEKARRIFKVEMGDMDVEKANEWFFNKPDSDEALRDELKKLKEEDPHTISTPIDYDSIDIEKEDDDNKCDNCGGRGFVTNPRVRSPADEWYVNCPSCGGTGKKR